MGLAGILLAAGSGSRFGGDKLLAALPEATHLAPAGTPIGVAAARHLEAGMRSFATRRFDRASATTSAPMEIVAVVRPGDAALAWALAGARARVVACCNADDGMGASLACGVTAADGADGWIVALADMPWIAPATIAAVAEAIAMGAAIAAPVYLGRRGHPVGFARRCLEALRALGGDEGARQIVCASSDELTLLAVDDPGVVRDVDFASDLAPPPAAQEPVAGRR